jgi:hypothetical protein
MFSKAQKIPGLNREPFGGIVKLGAKSFSFAEASLHI